MLRLDIQHALPFLPEGALEALQPALEAAQEALVSRSGAGNDFLGWLDLALNPDEALLADIEATAARIRANADVLLCVGIGGSYLGAQAVIDALQPYFGRTGPEVLFAGHHMSGAYHEQLLAYLEGKSVYVNVISKSGTTLEPALAFRAIRTWMEARFPDAADRIIATTDPVSGALETLRTQLGYKKYAIPPDVGGRFSVLTPVGLLPIAVAGVDIRALTSGAQAMARQLQTGDASLVYAYAGVRAALLREGKSVDLLAVLEPKLRGIGGWWQQLYGESEGKDGQGLFPVCVQYSTDLHSIGQFVQDGTRSVLETFLMLEDDGGHFPAPPADNNLDGLDYLVGQPYTHINRKAYEGTLKAHVGGGVPVMTLWMDALTPFTLGELLYFFEHAVGVSGYVLGVNPFDQPGVEAYKKEMFSLLGKP